MITSLRSMHLALALGIATSAMAQTTRDSAGIRIVENARPAWTAGQEWRLSARPLVEIGGGTGPGQELGRVTDVTRLSDGRIVVADGSSLQLLFYDSTGRYLSSAGGKGQGPGEFREFNEIRRLPGDSIAVELIRTASIFSPGGTFVRSVRFGPFPDGVLQIPLVVAMERFDNGTAIVWDYPQGQRRPAGASRWVDSSSLFLVGPDGGVIRSLGTAPVVTFAMGKTRPSPMEFGPDAPHASNGRNVVLGFTDKYEFRVYDPNWKIERIVRRSWTPRRFTDREIAAYVDGWMDMWSTNTGEQRATERREMLASAYPEFLPAYSALLMSPTGDVWVREPDLTGAPGCWCLAGLGTVPSRWSVFDASGRWLGDVTMPPRFVPLEIGSAWVLGRSRDANDVPHAVMYRLEKGNR